MLIDDSFGGMRLHDFIMHQGKDLRPGVIPVYNGCHWVLGQLNDSGKGVDNAVVNTLVESNKEQANKIATLENTIATLREKITSLEANETSLEKWIDVQFNNEQEKTVSDSFITDKTIVDYNDDSGEHDADPITTVDNGSVTISFVKPVTGTVRLQLSKKKE